jgi:T-complex protein 1 subunit eta
MDDLQRVSKATGAILQTTAQGLTPDVLGKCGKFEEVQLGNERYNMFTGCEKTKSTTLVLRGGAAQYLEETQRSLNDAIMIVRRAFRSKAIVAGGGAIEMELSRFLREYLRNIEGKTQLVVNGFAKALETIPRTLAENSGMNSTDVLNKLRQKHAQGGEEGMFFGVNVLEGNVDDMYQKFVWEPEEVRINVLQAAAEAACAILSVDRTIRNPKSEQAQAQAAGRLDGSAPPGMGRGAGRGRGRGMNMQGLRTMRGRGGK